VASVAIVAALAGCSSSGKSEGASTSTAASSVTTVAGLSPTCQAVDQFKTAVSALATPATLTGGKSSVQTAVDNVKTSLDNLKSQLSSGDKPKVDAVESSFTDLQNAVKNLNGVSGLTGVITAGRTFSDAAGNLLSALKAGCPSS
jgi:hypothetical protein